MHKHKFGTCPECGCLYLDYGDITWNDMNLDPSIQQEITCEACGCKFNEIYNVKPDTVDIIWHGKAYKPNTKKQQNSTTTPSSSHIQERSPLKN